MRLGDLDALKKAIKSYADDQYAENEYLGECAIMAIIDNAPTVEAFTLLQVKELFDLNVKLIDEVENLKKERPQGDLISRSVVKGMISDKSIPIKFEEEKIGEWQYSSGVILSDIYNVIDNAPTVEPCYQTTSCLDCGNYDKENHNCPRFCEVIRNLVNEVKERPQGEWIPVKTRELTAEEKEEHPDITFMWDCHLPDDGQDVIITTSWGDVKICTFCVDDIGSYFDETDEDDVLAWMPLPESYTKEDFENDNKV